jgi:FkbM family methyltransferase
MEEIEIGGESVQINAEGHEDFIRVVNSSGWEEETFRFLRENCSSSTTFFDIGAWIGLMSIYARRLEAKVICVEPDPKAFAELQSNLELNGCTGITAINKAAGKETGKLELYYDGELAKSTSSAIKTSTNSGKVTVEVFPLQELAKMVAHQEDCVVKIDIEGYEYELGDQISVLLDQLKAPTHFSLHPRSLVPKGGLVSTYFQRIRAWKKTCDLLDSITTHDSFHEDGRKMGAFSLFFDICRPRYTRNFSAVLVPIEGRQAVANFL